MAGEDYYESLFWVVCYNCLASYIDSPQPVMVFSSCGCIFCSTCVSDCTAGGCTACSKPQVRVIKIGRKMPSNLQSVFKRTEDAIAELNKISTFLGVKYEASLKRACLLLQQERLEICQVEKRKREIEAEITEVEERNSNTNHQVERMEALLAAIQRNRSEASRSFESVSSPVNQHEQSHRMDTHRLSGSPRHQSGYQPPADQGGSESYRLNTNEPDDIVLREVVPRGWGEPLDQTFLNDRSALQHVTNKGGEHFAMSAMYNQHGHKQRQPTPGRLITRPSRFEREQGTPDQQVHIDRQHPPSRQGAVSHHASYSQDIFLGQPVDKSHQQPAVFTSYQDQPATISSYEEQPPMLISYQEQPSTYNSNHEQPPLLSSFQEQLPAGHSNYPERSVFLSNYHPEQLPVARECYQKRTVGGYPVNIQTLQNHQEEYGEPMMLIFPQQNSLHPVQIIKTGGRGNNNQGSAGRQSPGRQVSSPPQLSDVQMQQDGGRGINPAATDHQVFSSAMRGTSQPQCAMVETRRQVDPLTDAENRYFQPYPPRCHSSPPVRSRAQTGSGGSCSREKRSASRWVEFAQTRRTDMLRLSSEGAAAHRSAEVSTAGGRTAQSGGGYGVASQTSQEQSNDHPISQLQMNDLRHHSSISLAVSRPADLLTKMFPYGVVRNILRRN